MTTVPQDALLAAAGPSPEGLARFVLEYGWRDGLERYTAGLGEAATYLMRWSLALRHTSWKGFLPAGRRSRAVVIDRGWGTSVITLAGGFERVDAIFTDRALLEVTRARAMSLGIGNVDYQIVTRLDAVAIDPNTIDAVALCELPCGDLTDTLLETLRSAMRSDAVLFLSLLAPARTPGGLASMAAAHWSLRRHFQHRRSFRYQGPPVSAAEIIPLRLDAGSARARAANALAPVRSPALGIVATNGAPLSLFDVVVREVDERLGRTRGTLTIERFFFSNPIGFTLAVRDAVAGSRLLVKIPFHAAGVERMASNFAHLSALGDVAGAHARLFPRPIVSGTVAGQHYFVESAVSGAAPDSADLRDPGRSAQVMEKATGWLTEFHAVTAGSTAVGPRDMARLVVEPVDAALAYLDPDASRPALRRLRAFLIDAVQRLELRPIFSHGDFTPDNILFDETLSTLTGVFDWDLADARGLPLVDLLYYFLTSERALSGTSTVASTADILVHKLLARRFSEPEDRALTQYLQRLKLPGAAVAPLTLLMWLHHLGVRMRAPERYRFSTNDWDGVIAALPAVLDRAEADMDALPAQHA